MFKQKTKKHKKLTDEEKKELMEELQMTLMAQMRVQAVCQEAGNKAMLDKWVKEGKII